MKAGDWVISSNGEAFESEGFTTKEEAIAEAPDMLDVLPGDPFWVARVSDLGALFDADDVLDLLNDRLSDRIPEAYAELWEPKLTTAAAADFNQMFQEWLRRHGLHPEDSCFTVDSMEQCTVPEEDEDLPNVGCETSEPEEGL